METCWVATEPTVPTRVYLFLAIILKNQPEFPKRGNCYNAIMGIVAFGLKEAFAPIDRLDPPVTLHIYEYHLSSSVHGCRLSISELALLLMSLGQFTREGRVDWNTIVLAGYTFLRIDTLVPTCFVSVAPHFLLCQVGTR